MIKNNFCSIVPYFKINDGNMSDFKSLCKRFSEATSKESGCLFYGFTFFQDIAHCREGYIDGKAVLEHLDNVGGLLKEALELSELMMLEIHGPQEEIEKLREPLANLNPTFFSIESYDK